jgi:hypothetical protein
MSTRRAPKSLARRATAALLVGFWLAGLVGSIFHDADHEHRYCSQHGTFEEAGARPTDAAAASAAAATPEHDRSIRSGDATLRGEGHESCAFADLGVRAPLTDTATVSQARPTPPAPAAAPPVVHVASPIPLLANAPKASPPALHV